MRDDWSHEADRWSYGMILALGGIPTKPQDAGEYLTGKDQERFAEKEPEKKKDIGEIWGRERWGKP